MSLFTDYITVLSVRYPRDAVMTKRLYRAANGIIDKSDYNNATKFDVQKIGINDLADLCGVLFDVSKQPNKVVIRGCRSPDTTMSIAGCTAIGRHLAPILTDIVGCSRTSMRCRCRCFSIPMMIPRSSLATSYVYCRLRSTVRASIGNGHAVMD